MENPMWGPDWAEIRAQWPLVSGVAHLNHGSFGATPTAVMKAQERLRLELASNPDRFFRRRLRDLLEDARRQAAAFCHADLDGFALVANASTGVSTVLGSIELAPGDEVLVNDHAYDVAHRAVERACRRSGASRRVVQIPLFARDDIVVERILGAVGPCTRLVVIDHVACRTARRFPVEDLVAALRKREVPVLVDAAHAPGMVDVDLGELQPDYWVGSFHKWAGAPPAAAGLYVAPERRPMMEPLVAPVAPDGSHQEFPHSYDWPGTFDPTALLVIPVALQFMAELEWGRLQAHNQRLAEHGRLVLAKALNTLDGSPSEPLTAMALVALPAGLLASPTDAVALQRSIAEELATELTVVFWQDRGWVRLSAQVYNAPEEYERLAGNLPGLLRQSRKTSETATPTSKAAAAKQVAD